MNFHQSKLILFLSLIAFIMQISTFAQGLTEITDLDVSKLPASIKHEGKIRHAVKFTDQSGIYMIVLAETGNYQNKKFEHEEDGLDAELFAYNFLMTHENPVQVWRVYDFIKDCPLDMEATFLKNAFQITDLNNDGVAEVWVMYKMACHGDVSPYDMKVIMYQGKQKFAMRGRNKVKISENEFEGGDYKFDNTFMNGPKVFTEFALALWNNNIMQTWD